MTIRNLYPDIRPSLNLDFANSKRLDSRVTFTRSSTGTYTDESGIIRTAAANEARFDHDTDGNSLGLLIEESRTNLETQSTTLTTYATSNATLPGQTITAPDGSLSTVKLLTENTNTSTHHIIRSYGANYDSWRWSFFVKPNGRTKFRIYTIDGSGGLVRFDLTNMTVNGNSSPNVLQQLANGWYKVQNVGATYRPFNLTIMLEDDSGNHIYTGDGTSGLYVWGVQLEQGASVSFSTSYIPTSGSTVTRSADVASMTGTNFSSWYNQSEGTVVTKITDNGEPNTSNNRDIFYLGQGQSSGNNRIITTTGSVIGAYVQTTAAQVSITGGWYTKGVETVGAFAYKQDDFALATDGVVRGTANLGNVPTCNRLYLFMNRNQTNTLTGHFSRFTYYPTRLPDATLQALTL